MSDLVRSQEMPTASGSINGTVVAASGDTGGASGLPTIPGYDLLGNLGAGAMGEVFLARSQATGQEVALKLVTRTLMDRPDLLKRFEREVKILSTLRHPNIAGAIGSGRCDGRLFLAMEYVRGPTLASLLKVAGAFTEIDALRITMQVAQALDYAWQKSGLIHRDIKPANLLAVPEADGGEGERVKIIDYGLARSAVEEDLSMTMTGMIMGTPNYMSPEQVRGEKNLGPQADMYALGCTMFHMLTGKLPYTANAPAQVMAAHLKDPIPDPGALVPSLTAATRHLVMTCMAKDPGKRYASYAPLVTACETAMRTISLRDTTSIRLLRRPLVLSRPTNRPIPPKGKDAPAANAFDKFETARLHRHVKESDQKPGDPYKPSTDRYPTPNPENAPKPTNMRAGSATAALAKAATERFQRTKSTTAIHRKGQQGQQPGTGRQEYTAGGTSTAGTQIPIPQSPGATRLPIQPISEPPPERHIMAWLVVALTVAGFVIAAVLVL